MENHEINEDELLFDEDGNYAFLTFGGHLYTPRFIETIDKNRCERCGKCLEMCETRDLDEDGNVIAAFPELCYGCGHCIYVCLSKAIEAKPIPLEEMIRRVKKSKL